MKNSLFFLLFLAYYSPAFSQGAAIANDIKNYIEAKKSEGFDTKEGREPSAPPTKAHSIGGQTVDEANSTIFKAFQLHPDWKDVVLVADWTGSMYPFVGQVMAWHQTNIQKKILLDMLLFNDGDDQLHPNQNKVVGSTGGLYWANPNKTDEWLKTIEKAVDNGGGGDSEENDLEALLAAQKKYPHAKELVLIADNSAVRDMALLPKITKPVHVILCNQGWVLDYIKIAYETGGTITILSDQLDFSDKTKVDKNNIYLAGMRYSL